MRLFICMAALAAAVSASAQTPSPEPARIDFPSVSAALTALESRDGNGTTVTHSDGWTIVNEPLASAQWSFTPSGHYAHPAVVRRVIKRPPADAVTVEVSSLCEAPAAECSKLLAEFHAMNERITQAVKAQGRQGSAQTAP